MAPEAPRERNFTARLDCRYLLEVPPAIDARTLLVVTLHGFGFDPESMLRMTAGAFGPGHATAAIEGPYQFFHSVSRPDVGFGWITNRHPETSIRLHHDMVRHVLDEAGRECGIPPERRVLVGFSQPVGMNYRLVATHPECAGGVVGICGGLPADWEAGPYQDVTARVLHIARSEDEFYDTAVTERYPERLRLRARDVEFHMLEGKHRFPSRAKPIVAAWVERILR